MIGLPGCGKSTWLSDRHINAISSDEMRRLLTDDAADQTVNKTVFFLVRQFLRMRLRIGKDVTYIDATNLTRKERRQYIKIAREFNAEVEAIYFDVPIETCKQRNRERNRIVPDVAIDYLAGKLQPPQEKEGFTKIVRVSGRTQTTTSAAAAQPDL